MSKATIKAEIDANITQNGTGAITGNILNGVLKDMIDATMTAGYKLAGVASLTTDPGTPSENVFYFATEFGEYENFGLSVAEGEVAIFKFNGTSWSKEVTGIATKEEMDLLYTSTPADLSSVELVDGVINTSSNTWITAYKAKGKIVPISLIGKKFRWLGEGKAFAFLTNNDTPVEGVSIPYVSGTSFILAQDKAVYDVPNGALFLFIPVAYNGTIYNISIEKFLTPHEDLNNRMGISAITNNLGNIDSSLFTFNDTILQVDGTTFDILNYKTTNYLPVENGMVAIGHSWATTFTNFALYDSNKNFIVAKTGDNVIDTNDYPNAVYFRAVLSPSSNPGIYLNVFTAGVLKSILLLSEKINQQEGYGNVYEVGTGKQYTTLRSAMADAIQKKDSKVIVYPGVYDLAQEFAAELANHSGSGILLTNGVHLIAMPGVYVKCLVDVTNTWAYDYFDPFRVGDDFTLENINIEAKNTRYCVHDERAGQGTYHHRYLNCQMKYTNENQNPKYVQCIGGGMGEHGYIEIIGGNYESHSLYPSSKYTIDELQLPISYHNGNNANCDGHIVIRDVYLKDKGYLRFGYYGASTIQTPVQVSGSRMYKNILLKSEGDIVGTPQNFVLIQFNNEIVDPS